MHTVFNGCFTIGEHVIEQGDLSIQVQAPWENILKDAVICYRHVLQHGTKGTRVSGLSLFFILKLFDTNSILFFRIRRENNVSNYYLRLIWLYHIICGSSLKCLMLYCLILILNCHSLKLSTMNLNSCKYINILFLQLNLVDLRIATYCDANFVGWMRYWRHITLLRILRGKYL